MKKLWSEPKVESLSLTRTALNPGGGMQMDLYNMGNEQYGMRLGNNDSPEEINDPCCS